MDTSKNAITVTSNKHFIIQERVQFYYQMLNFICVSEMKFNGKTNSFYLLHRCVVETNSSDNMTKIQYNKSTSLKK